jgi:hypothetical protein
MVSFGSCDSPGYYMLLGNCVRTRNDTRAALSQHTLPYCVTAYCAILRYMMFL